MSNPLNLRRLAALIAVLGVASALVAPAAFARPALEGPPPSSLSASPQPPAERTVVETISDPGFDWGAAAIGAGIGAAAILLAMGMLTGGRRPLVRFTH